MLSISRLRYVPGVGRTLCKPVGNNYNDSPYKNKNYVLPRVPRDYNNHLPCGDTDRLLAQATHYLLYPFEDSTSTWNVFLRRCDESAHLLNPTEAAIILQAIVERTVSKDRERGLKSKLIASQIRRVMLQKTVSGSALVTLIDVCSKDVPLCLEALTIFCKKIPSVLHELSFWEIVKTLSSLQRAQSRQFDLCRHVHRKLLAGLRTADGNTLAETSTVLGFHEFRSHEIFKEIDQRANMIGPQFFLSKPHQMASLLSGFMALSLPPPRITALLASNYSRAFPMKEQRQAFLKYLEQFPPQNTSHVM